MILLAIETSCDETAAAVVEDGRKVLSNVVHTQIEEHRLYGGVVPEIASRRHAEMIGAVTRDALEGSGLSLGDLDGVAVTAMPGLIGALLVGVGFAKGLAYAAGKPVIPVHHIRGHIAAAYLAYPELKPPFLALVASGGHSHIVKVEDYTRFVVVGRTRDDAAGEAFDKAARVMGLPYPGGPAIDRAAREGTPCYPLPQPKIEGAPYDFSFSGLKTAVINLWHNAEQKGEALRIPDLAASFQEAAVGMLVDHTMRAASDLQEQKLVLAGGVAANSMLRARLEARCQEEGRTLYLPPLHYCSDNAAMIGAQGYYEAIALMERSGGAIPPMLDLNARAVCGLERMGIQSM